MSDSLAVIFDVDGVLVDSYRAHFESWRTLAEEYGFQRTEEEFAHTFGRTSWEILEELGFTGEQIPEMDARKEAYYRQSIAEDFPAIPGAVALIDSLGETGFAVAAGSSGPPENVDLVLERLGRRERFAAVVTGRDVARGKPDPEVFVKCADQLGVPPSRCAVIEDAAPGVAAAKAAGMTCIGFASTGRTRAELAEADHVVDRLDELTPETIRRWIEVR